LQNLLVAILEIFFKIKGGIVADIQSEGPSLKTFRNEQTSFLFSSSLQGSLTIMRRNYNNKKPQLCLQICAGNSNTAKSIAQASSRKESSKAEITFQ